MAPWQARGATTRPAPAVAQTAGSQPHHHPAKMNINPILYKAVVYKKRTRLRVEGAEQPNFDAAFEDAKTLWRTHDAKVVLVLRTSSYPANAGQFYLDWILK